MKKISLILLSIFSSITYAGIHCPETVTGAILHKNSNVYFTTNKTCKNSWCQIKWTGDGDKNRALSMLLTAKASGKDIKFYWEDIDSCEVQNKVYASPGYITY